MDKQTSHGRGPAITAKVRRLIAEEYILDTSRTAKEVMLAVHECLGGIHSIRPGWPGESAVSKELTHIRKKVNERGSDLLDMPFSLGAVVDHNIPAEAIPILLDMRAIERLSDPTEKPLTVRQARWVAKLYIATQKLEPSSTGSDRQILRYLAVRFAEREKVCELYDQPYDNSDLDELMLFCRKFKTGREY